MALKDPRIPHTRNALRDAIIELASKTPVSKVTVTDITRTAGINRATFYKHASSPGGLLASALKPELDQIRLDDQAARAASTPDGAEITRGTIEQVIDHIGRHRDIYRLSLPDPRDASLHQMLAEHITDSALQHIRQLPPESLPESLSADVAASYFAHAFVGAIQPWLLGKRISRTALVHTVTEMVPAWWR
jgi:AcrR family transcriptional regulator